jgi:hypothetical protein
MDGWMDKRLADSQEGMNSMELIIYTVKGKLL